MNIRSMLERCSIPPETADRAVAQLEKARSIYKKNVAPFSWRAPFVMFKVCRKLPWGS